MSGSGIDASVLLRKYFTPRPTSERKLKLVRTPEALEKMVTVRDMSGQGSLGQVHPTSFAFFVFDYERTALYCTGTVPYASVIGDR